MNQFGEGWLVEARGGQRQLKIVYCTLLLFNLFHPSESEICWENCQLLQSNFPVWWGTICDEKRICYPGCEEACQFHVEIGGGQREPVVQTRGEEVITVAGGVASWPRPYRSEGPFVYVVMRRLGQRPWRQISQGLRPVSRVPEGGILRVLVVNRDGLVAIYSPSRKSSSSTPLPPAPRNNFATAKAILESIGLGHILPNYPPVAPQTSGKRINTQIVPTTTFLNNNILEDSRSEGRRPWNLREVSLIHQKYLVIAEIAWDARRPTEGGPRKPFYFVTWEVDGGGLKGNLLTESTAVTLSLCTDTVYHIQVEVAAREGEAGNEQSEELVVDTGRAVAVELDNSASRWVEGIKRIPSTTPTHELILGAAAALALFLVIVVILILHSRRSRRSKFVEQLPPLSPPVFPAMVHVVDEDERLQPAQSSACSNLPRGTLHV
ncbi:Hypothetical protein NTJ_06707 [Nesidiocoris tenuis]|uniref:Fibronectin type-III domain-containing protein n=1 Tax=Nesidiocoris tenuis TaxID=355587 RepID=A0ABN7ANU5_9HEMI|nr:Hypothetical protein NTJ_06707 [Nesidiocoris tenuis]